MEGLLSQQFMNNPRMRYDECYYTNRTKLCEQNNKARPHHHYLRCLLLSFLMRRFLCCFHSMWHHSKVKSALCLVQFVALFLMSVLHYDHFFHGRWSWLICWPIIFFVYKYMFRCVIGCHLSTLGGWDICLWHSLCSYLLYYLLPNICGCCGLLIVMVSGYLVLNVCYW